MLSHVVSALFHTAPFDVNGQTATLGVTMPEIQLLYVINVMNRKKSYVQQELTFYLLIENLGFHKSVDILWSGEDGVQQTLTATFHCSKNATHEFWCAKTLIKLDNEQSLAGNIEFVCRYRVNNTDYIANDNGKPYRSEADSGLRLFVDTPVFHIDYTPTIANKQNFLPITVAVSSMLPINQVTVHWTTDNWLTTRKTQCLFKHRYWDKEHNSNARNPNQYHVSIWHTWLRLGQTFRIHYCISAETAQEELVYWDNNDGANYTLAHEPLKVMILNLHCYQEDNQDAKLTQIAKAIDELDVDVVCFQEVAEPWNNGDGDWEQNAAKLINQRLPTPYHVANDFSHLGFERYREGVALLSRYPIIHSEARYVSDSEDTYNIHSRKVVMAQIDIPHIGFVNFFTAHLSWPENGFANQFNRLNDWASALHQAPVVASLLCGDFNIAQTSDSYQQVIEQYQYIDQYAQANTDNPLPYGPITHPYRQINPATDYRIDYIFAHPLSELAATQAYKVFTERDYGRVSDHYGYFFIFEPLSLKVKSASNSDLESPKN